MTKLLSLLMAVISLAIGTFFAVVSIWLIAIVVMSGGHAGLYAGLPIVFSGFVALFFFLVANACRMTARADKDMQTRPSETFE